ncbi:DMP19 family protein [Aureliella helgolandensis]|uniref:DNA mimic protein DMP19 C-terminal domain-containing protein n=1 Tax=Aureliella helgolandensis TaxID=2527968 RepID=A0A518G0W4_9BACT|nr:DUF4375 domain-containing protein [Aureliella helgolandensis]QDV22242.1 hypothetical protein Q31a_05260 [Aureliella helgolandensis]
MYRHIVLQLTLSVLVTGCGSPEVTINMASMDDDTLLEKMSDIAFQKMDAADDVLSKVDEPYRTVAIIYAAQGVIDNGGLVYFFENDWPRTPPYSIYADAYERIDRLEAAQAIRDAAASFGVKNPEKDIDSRRQYIENHYNEDEFEVDGWNDCVCGDEQVWSNLATWVRHYSAE